MSLIVWILLGLAAGLVAGQAATSVKVGATCRIALGITIAGLAGACAYHFTGGVEVTFFQFWSMTASMIGAVIVLVAHEEHGLRLGAQLRADSYWAAERVRDRRVQGAEPRRAAHRLAAEPSA